ncbi:hypothetical protein IPF37_00010 [bacterium]|nr:MAG: hypothetical protein IPF37_00010 [bacterium]
MNEELIFRGIDYRSSAPKFLSPLQVSLVGTHFYVVSRFSNPLNLLTVDYKLGLGLFLAGPSCSGFYFISGKIVLRHGRTRWLPCFL